MRDMAAIVRFVIAFTVTLFLSTIACTFIWETCINGRLYVCTDPGWLDFLDPGNWVHGKYVEVDRFDHPRSMSEPDAVLAGWSKQRLWFLWYGFVGLAVAVSFLVAKKAWSRKSPSS